MRRRVFALTVLFLIIRVLPLTAQPHLVPFTTREDVIAIVDSLTSLPTDPEIPPPPPPPPPPTPPPGSGDCVGSVALGGVWTDWCADERRNFGEEAGGVGTMIQNAKAAHRLPATLGNQGAVEVDVYFGNDVIPCCLGGGHLLQVASSHIAFGGGAPYLGWLRPDVYLHSDGTWRVSLYNSDAAGGNIRVTNWKTGQRAGPVKTWTHLKLGWKLESDTRFTVVLNGASHTFDVQPGSKPIAYVVVGNWDMLTRFPGDPIIKFKNWRW